MLTLLLLSNSHPFSLCMDLEHRKKLTQLDVPVPVLHWVCLHGALHPEKTLKHQDTACDTGHSCISNPVSPQHPGCLLHCSPATSLLKCNTQTKAILMANNDWDIFWFKIKLVSGKDHWHCPHPGDRNSHS